MKVNKILLFLHFTVFFRIGVLGCFAFSYSLNVHAQTPVEVCVSDYNGAPSLHINGEPVPAAMYVQAGDPNTNGYSQMSAQGYSLFGVAIDTGWKGYNAYDYSQVDSRIQGITSADPDAYIILRLVVSAPVWWCNDLSNSNELIVCSDGTGYEDNEWGGTKHQSFASKKWLDEESEAITNLIGHINTKSYSNNIIGFLLLNGVNGEWHLWSPDHLPDNSEPMRQELVQWCSNKYETVSELNTAWGSNYNSFSEITCPSDNDRKFANYGIFKNILIDPTGWKVPDYWNCLHDVSANAIIHFCKLIKDETNGRLLTGAFYGYTTTHWPQEGGHLKISKVLDSQYIDFLASPHSYQERDLGDSGPFRTYPESIRLHGKLFFDEGDERTYLASPSIFKHATNVAESVAVMKREALSTLTFGAGFWWFDIERDWFNDTNLLNVAGAIHRLSVTNMSLCRESYSQVAVVLNPDTYYSTKDWIVGEDSLMDELCKIQLDELQKSGMPYDVLLLDDLMNSNVKDYKLYLFLNTWSVENSIRQFIMSNLQKDGKVLAFVYAPGFVTEQGIRLWAMQDITGMQFSPDPGNTNNMRAVWTTAAVDWLEGVTNGQSWGISSVMKPRFSISSTNLTALANWEQGGGVSCGISTLDNWTSVYCGTGKLPVELLRALGRRAGVHSWTDAGLAGSKFWAGSGLFGVHTENQVDCRFELPVQSRVTEAFTGEIILNSGDCFTNVIPANSTEIYHMEPLATGIDCVLEDGGEDGFLMMTWSGDSHSVDSNHFVIGNSSMSFSSNGARNFSLMEGVADSGSGVNITNSFNGVVEFWIKPSPSMNKIRVAVGNDSAHVIYWDINWTGLFSVQRTSDWKRLRLKFNGPLITGNSILPSAEVTVDGEDVGSNITTGYTGTVFPANIDYAKIVTWQDSSAVETYRLDDFKIWAAIEE